MNILLISQCSKRALIETRRILDQFAERKGDRVWQTAITQQGMLTLRKMLKKTARRNTAVACHWIHGKDHSDIIWVVGNRSRFNIQGTVPTNTTERDILRSRDENHWHTAETIALLAGIAGLFHDFGKANLLFQQKLKKATGGFEPYRHEWVSLRLFQAFVGGGSDQEWLQALHTVDNDCEQRMLACLQKDQPEKFANPFRQMPSLAQMVGWLIVSHHKLPGYTDVATSIPTHAPPLDRIDDWFTSHQLAAHWNSPQCARDWREKEIQGVWTFKQGTPMLSATWQKKAQRLAARALKHVQILNNSWLQDTFTSHLARLSLMLADHVYSASEVTLKWQDKKYKAYANTDRKTRKLKQKLDEHNVGVGHNAYLFARSLPWLRQGLPAITHHKGFKQRSKDARFRWQDKAYDLACGLRERSEKQGFFGINMASTGKGKTFANARIMYGLANESLGCRFSVALGLRTLTLQTGDALQERLHLTEDDLAVLIGSQAVRELHAMVKIDVQADTDAAAPLSAEQSGSESLQDFFDDHQYVRYEGTLDDGRLSAWLKASPKLHQLVSAPVLVSTIDHLMPATEGVRGGKQIAPMLRLLTADLVLDEPDDFDLKDLPALPRLVHWAGLLGARVLLSSATLPPALLNALFDAYQDGRRRYAQACGEPGTIHQVCCAWFDEFDSVTSAHGDRTTFAAAHNEFVGRRLRQLQSAVPLRRVTLANVQSDNTEKYAVVKAVAQVLADQAYQLHAHHHQVHPPTGKRVSIGLVRMANINPMVAVARNYLQKPAKPDSKIYFCIYHSQHPLLMRSDMEKNLDQALTRHNAEALWQLPSISQHLQNSKARDHIFIVFATAVAEVGRDHDYDWAIVEPSSMRSMIQLAGRIQRHRQFPPQTPNMVVLNQNIKALCGENMAYCRPGFETKEFCLSSKDLHTILEEDQYREISAAPRIKQRNVLLPEQNLVDLEHAHLQARLFNEGTHALYASLWWQHNATWCAELQRRSPFRAGAPQEDFVLFMDEEGEAPLFYRFSERGELLAAEQEFFQRQSLPLGEGVSPWFSSSPEALLLDLAEARGWSVAEVCLRFARVGLRVSSSDNLEKWCYDPLCGVYHALE